MRRNFFCSIAMASSAWLIGATLIGTPARGQQNAEPSAAPASRGDGLSGLAGFYHDAFHGQRTASGQPYNAGAMTAAHPTLPFGTKVKVTHVKNKRSVVVHINDRGPMQAGRVIDLSRAAAAQLHMVREGLSEVRLEVVK